MFERQCPTEASLRARPALHRESAPGRGLHSRSQAHGASLGAPTVDLRPHLAGGFGVPQDPSEEASDDTARIYPLRKQPPQGGGYPVVVFADERSGEEI